MSTPFVPTYNINGIDVGFDFTDFPNIVSGSVDDDGPKETVRFKCAYEDRADLVMALMGGITVDGGSFSRQAPFQHPDNDQLFCTGIPDWRGLKPFIDEDGWPRYQWAILTASFSAPNWQYFDNDPGGNNDPSGLAWTRTKFRESAEVFQPPFGSFYIGPFTGGTGTLIDEATVGVLRPRVEISMTRLLVPMFPLDDTMELIGSVNEDEIQFGDRTFPRGCLLFAGCSSEPRNDPQGLPCQDIEYTLLGNRTIEWNQFMAKDGTYQFLNTKNDESGDYPFPYEDWSILP